MTLALAKQGCRLFASPLVTKEVRHENVRRWIAAMNYLHARNIHASTQGNNFVFVSGKMRDPEPPPKAAGNIKPIKVRTA